MNDARAGGAASGEGSTRASDTWFGAEVGAGYGEATSDWAMQARIAVVNAAGCVRATP
jgi:hypothetical protein